MILDDGGDATLLVHKGVEYEAAGAVPDPAGADSEELRIILETLERSLAESPDRFTRMAAGSWASPRRPRRASTACTSSPATASCSSRRST